MRRFSGSRTPINTFFILKYKTTVSKVPLLILGRILGHLRAESSVVLVLFAEFSHALPTETSRDLVKIFFYFALQDVQSRIRKGEKGLVIFAGDVTPIGKK